MNSTNYTPTPGVEDFMHNFMYDLSHMMDDQDISPEKRLEQYSDSKHLKELRKESIELGRAMISRATNATIQNDYLGADNDKELGTCACATSAVCSMDPTDAATADYEAFVVVMQEENRRKRTAVLGAKRAQRTTAAKKDPRNKSIKLYNTNPPQLLTENVDKLESVAVGRSQSPSVDLSEQIAKVAI